MPKTHEMMTPLQVANAEKVEHEALEKGEWIEPHPVKIAEICGRILGIGLWVAIGLVGLGAALAYMT